MSIFPAKIVLAIDGSEEAGLAAEAATELSRDTGSEVHVTYVLPTPEELIGHHFYSPEIRESLIEQARRRPGVPRRAGGATQVGRREGDRHPPQDRGTRQGDHPPERGDRR